MTLNLGRSRWRQGRWTGPAALAVCVALCLLADLSGLFNRLELKSIDWRFEARAEAELLLGSEKRTPEPVVLIEITDASLKLIREPFLLWDGHFAKVAEALADSGARVAAFDILWLKSAEDFVTIRDSPRKAMVRAFLRLRQGGRLVLASLGAARRTDGDASLGRHALAIGDEHFGPAEPLIDRDGLVRRQGRFYSTGGVSRPTFAQLTASRSGASAGIRDTVLIDYAVGPLPFERWPFHEVLAKAQTRDREFFERVFGGKAVLIGSSAGILDQHPTPLGKETPGLYVQAFAVRTLLSGREFVLPGRGWEAALVVFLCLAAGLPALRWGAALVAAWTGALAIAYALALFTLFRRGVVLAAIGPLLSLPATFGLMFAYRFVVADRERRRVSGMLKSYVNERIVEMILRSPEGLPIKGQRRRICVMFSDIRGFTAMSQDMPPTKVVELLNRYLGAMSAVILAHDGTIDKFIGDGIMAYFGAPVADPAAALKAVRTALAMQERLIRLNRRWEKAGHPPLKIGIGIHMGEAVVGNIGSPRKMDFTAVGDTVNLASRIEGMTKEFQAGILLTEDAYREVEAAVEADALGEAEVRGHAPVRVFALRGWKEKGQRQSP